MKEKLKQRRKELGLTQKELAKLSGVGEWTIARIETGKANPTVDILERLCKVLKLQIYLESF